MLTEQALATLGLSLKIASVGVVCSLPLALLAAWLLARKRFPGKFLVNALVHLPLVMPPVVTGYFLLVALNQNSLPGQWLAENLGLVFAFRWTGAALAGGIMGFPLLVRPLRLSFEHLDTRLEDAAATLGAPPWRVWLTVTLPLALPGLLAGLVLAFARAFGEFGATITFVSNIPGETRTLPIAIYTLIQMPGQEGSAMQLILISVVVALLALILSEVLNRRMRHTREAG